MNFDALEKTLRSRPEGAPTDLELDRLVTGQLDPEEAREIEARAMGFPETAARLAELRRGLAAFPDVDERPILANIRKRLSDEPKGLLSRLNVLWMMAPVAAVGVLGLLLWPQGPAGVDGADGPALPEDAVRLKGTIKLEVVRKRGDKAEAALSGASFEAGDTLRFVVSLPSDAHIAIVGVEQDGTLYTAWPLPSHDAEPELKAGLKQALPGAVTLDDKGGREMLYLIACPPGVSPGCTSQGASKPPTCAKGCRSTPFELRKE